MTGYGRIAALALAAMIAMPGLSLAQDFRLLMIEQDGCYVCTQFNRDVAPAYAVSDEAAFAPLIHADLRGPLPEGVTLTSRPFVTPTFILLDARGHEVDRLNGFPGQEFFWPYLNEMFERARQRVTG
ncbi:MAG: hypothetical protein R3D60_12500 [Paracoccaceae bacterium]